MNTTVSKPSGSSRSLIAIKGLHTLVWACFVACIGAIWVFAWRGDYACSAWAIAVVLIEVAVLAMNHGRCPLSALARRFTDDDRRNFDIYVPAWLAGHTKAIFGTLFVGGIALTIASWMRHSISARP